MEEAKVGARRAEIMGPSGWVKPRETVNKRFLHSTLRNVVLSNRHKQQRRETRTDSHTMKDTARKKVEKVQS